MSLAVCENVQVIDLLYKNTIIMLSRSSKASGVRVADHFSRL